MAFDKYWLKLVDRTPELGDGGSRMTLTVAEFRVRVELAHAAGLVEGMERSRAAGDFSRRSEDNPFPGLFGSLFGKGRAKPE